MYHAERRTRLSKDKMKRNISSLFISHVNRNTLSVRPFSRNRKYSCNFREIATYFLGFDRERCRTDERVLKFHRRWRSADLQFEDVIGITQDLGKLNSGCNQAVAVGVSSCTFFFFLLLLSSLSLTTEDRREHDDDNRYYRIVKRRLVAWIFELYSCSRK